MCISTMRIKKTHRNQTLFNSTMVHGGYRIGPALPLVCSSNVYVVKFYLLYIGWYLIETFFFSSTAEKKTKTDIITKGGKFYLKHNTLTEVQYSTGHHFVFKYSSSPILMVVMLSAEGQAFNCQDAMDTVYSRLSLWIQLIDTKQLGKIIFSTLIHMTTVFVAYHRRHVMRFIWLIQLIDTMQALENILVDTKRQRVVFACYCGLEIWFISFIQLIDS